MTSMTRGPLSPVVYWRRRLVVVGVALTVMMFVVHALGGGADTAAPAARQAAAHPSTVPSSLPTVSAPATGTVGKTGTKRSGGKRRAATTGPAQTPTQPVLATPTGTCADDDVMVTPQVADSEVGQAVPLTLLLRTKTTAACTWTVSAAHLALKITRADNEIWSSRLCPQQLSSTDVVVRQAVVSSLQVDWDGKRAEPGCPRSSSWALPGRYHVDVAALGGRPDQSSFTLSPRTVVVTDPPAPDPTDNPSATGGGKGGTGATGAKGGQGTTSGAGSTGTTAGAGTKGAGTKAHATATATPKPHHHRVD